MFKLTKMSIYFVYKVGRITNKPDFILVLFYIMIIREQDGTFLHPMYHLNKYGMYHDVVSISKVSRSLRT